MTDFQSLGLNKILVKNLAEKGYKTPTPVQFECIPAVLDRRDIMAGAQTGTGKTAAFALPILHRLAENALSAVPDDQEVSSTSIKALVLAPTRELAQQVGKSFATYGTNTGLKTAVVYGGSSINSQAELLNQGVDILVATPGRLLDLVSRGNVSLNHIEFLVFDEADRMLDLGFMGEINRILKLTPKGCQTMLFSATFDDTIIKLSKTLLSNPLHIEVSERNAVATQVEQIAYEVDKDKKREIISYLIGSKNWHQVLVFTRTKQSADILASEMSKDGIKSLAIHGDKSQGARERALEEFKQGKVRALIATDVASRGLDIQQLKYVINFELPYNAEDYIHRIGRTGRAGEAGLAITLLSVDETWLLEDIQKLLDHKLLQQWLPGYEPDLNQDFSAKPANKKSPTKKRGGQRRRR